MNKNIVKKSFYYLRHGQTDWNVKGLAQGHSDIPLNEIGIQQALNSHTYFEQSNINIILHSPLVRAQQTAEIINQKLNCPIISIDELKECYLGSYEGRPVGPWIDDWKKGILKGDVELYKDFLVRVTCGLNKAFSYNKNILIVAHGLVYTAIREILNIYDNFHLENCVPIHHEINSLGHWSIKPLDTSCEFEL